MKSKRTWMLKLSTGDIVNDCRGLNLRIASIKEIRYSKVEPPMFLYRHAPERLVSFLESACRKIFGTYIYDRQLMLEDGNMCSARNCCSEENVVSKSA